MRPVCGRLHEFRDGGRHRLRPSPAPTPRHWAKRSGELAAALAPCEVRGLAFYPENLRKLHLDSPDEFLNLAGQFGFNRFYVCLTSPDSLEHPGLPVLLEAAERGRLPVEAVLPREQFM